MNAMMRAATRLGQPPERLALREVQPLIHFVAELVETICRPQQSEAEYYTSAMGSEVRHTVTLGATRLPLDDFPEK
jgi:hypothetical protein